MHRHHIIPKHEWKVRFGNLIGFNSSDNVVWLTIEQHAQVHRLLYELNNSEWDRIAYLVLTGKIGHEEASRLAVQHSNRRRIGIPHSPERILKRAASRARTYEFLDPNGNKIVIHNLAKFCRENNLNDAHMVGVHKQRIRCISHKGYRAV